MSPEFKIGETVSGTPYRIVQKIGQGGMGSVYEIEHVELCKRFVLKALLPQFLRRHDLVQRLRNEWRSLGQLDHPNIVSVTDARVAQNGVPFYVMERLQGETLAARLERCGRLEPLEALRVSIDMLDGLAAAHAIGIVHRDVKPRNIFLTRSGAAKLLDFGIVKLLDQRGMALTSRGIAIGTPRYMSPEQAAGERVDGRADLYAVGLVLFEMLVGHGPFDDCDSDAIFLAHLTKAAPRVRQFVPSMPREVDNLVAGLLQKAPAARPPGAKAAADIMRRMLREVTSVLPAEAVGAPLTAPAMAAGAAAAVRTAAAPRSGAPAGAVGMSAPLAPMSAVPVAPFGAVPMGAAAAAGPVLPQGNAMPPPQANAPAPAVAARGARPEVAYRSPVAYRPPVASSPIVRAHAGAQFGSGHGPGSGVNGAPGGGLAAMASGSIAVADRAAAAAASSLPQAARAPVPSGLEGTDARSGTDGSLRASPRGGETTAGRAAVPRPTLAQRPTRPSLVHALRSRPLRAKRSAAAAAEGCSPTVISSPVASLAPPEPPATSAPPISAVSRCEEPLSPTRTAVPAAAAEASCLPSRAVAPSAAVTAAPAEALPAPGLPAPHTPPPVSTDPPPPLGASGEFRRSLRPARGKVIAVAGTAALALGVVAMTFGPEEAPGGSGAPRSQSAPLAPAPFQAEAGESETSAVRSAQQSEPASQDDASDEGAEAKAASARSSAARPAARRGWSSSGASAAAGVSTPRQHAASSGAAAGERSNEPAAANARGSAAVGSGAHAVVPPANRHAPAARPSPGALAEPEAAGRPPSSPSREGKAPAAEPAPAPGERKPGTAVKTRRPLPGSGL